MRVEQASHALDGLQHGVVRAIRRDEQAGRGVGKAAQRRQHARPAAFIHDEGGFRRLADRRPFLEQGVQRGADVHHHPDGGNGFVVEVHRRQQAEKRESECQVPARFDRHGLGLIPGLAQRVGFGGGQVARDDARRREQQLAVGAHQVDCIVAGLFAQQAQPALDQSAQRRFGGQAGGIGLVPLGHDAAERHVAHQGLGVREPGFAPGSQVLQLQLVDQEQFPFRLMAVAILDILVDQVAAQDQQQAGSEHHQQG
ncbi:hypothetical protein [Castellaniella ginsengisoli]|uniref:Uncharacterized protein n=1 Tax=Castellaniella ginsengisoli TaxID=546114 RepID=A0AB39FSK9_9BURK